jgi:hypothetical protein
MPTALGTQAQQIAISYRWNAVDLAVSSVFFTADRGYRVMAITSRVDVAGTSVSGVTVAIRKVASGTAVGSGTLVHTGTVNLKGTANTNQAVALSGTPANLVLASGDSLAAELSGVATTAQGAVTVFLEAA